jgi:hypothetical protein
LKLGIIIPDRKDRPELMANCRRMMAAQTRQPDEILVMDYDPFSERVDIMQRYRNGYDMLTQSGMDLIAFIENDDWYHPEYLEVMEKEYVKAGHPDLFGTMGTVFYHLQHRMFYTFTHEELCVAMNTLIKPGLTIKWGFDYDPYADQWLWANSQYIGINSKGKYAPEKILSIGMKHVKRIDNESKKMLAGGKSHFDRLHRYNKEDQDMSFLKEHLDPESLEFYMEYSKKLNQ